jgi:hypothetical protein
VAHAHPCFSVAVVIWALVGMIVGQVRSVETLKRRSLLAQIRSLRNFSIIAQLAVGLNVTILCVSMGVISHSPPNRAVANAANDQVGYGPVVVEAFASNNLEGQVNGMFNLVFAYGGASAFCRKALGCSLIFLGSDFPRNDLGDATADGLLEGHGHCRRLHCHRLPLLRRVGCLLGHQRPLTRLKSFFYCFSGQFTQANAFQGLSPYWGQTRASPLLNLLRC